MEKRSLGRSDLHVGVLGLGCWQFGGGSYWGAQDQRDVERVVHGALDTGVNYFDTAEVYNDGASERSLGEALRGRRGEAIIGSKISPHHLYPSVLREHCDNTLRRLQTDYLDLYMLHWPISAHSIAHFTTSVEAKTHPPSIAEGFAALADLQREGKIRAIGISNHGIRQMQEVADTGIEIAANEMAYNLLSRAVEERILPHCADQGIGFIGYMPLQQGLLGGKTIESIRPMQARSRHFHHSRGEGTRHGEDGAEAEIRIALRQLDEVAAELGVRLGELALAWVIADRGVNTTIVGCRNTEQLEANIRSAALKLTSDTLARLNAITQPVWDKLGNNPDYYENRENSRIR